MAKRVEDLELDPIVVPIPEDFETTVDEWLASLVHGEPLELAVTGAELVAEGRSEDV